MQGIYKLINTNTQKVYIGSSNDIERRWKEHIRALDNNNHHSYKLQQNYNKTKDKDIFQFEVIEEVDNKVNLKEREQYYIDLYDAFKNGYNCSALVDNPKYFYKTPERYEESKIKEMRYKEFLELFNQYNNILSFKNRLKDKLLNKYASSLVYFNINNIIKWFLEKYNTDYNIKIDIIYEKHDKQYNLLIIDQDNNKFAWYKYCDEQICNNSNETKKLIGNLQKKGIYDKKIHYIVSVPKFVPDKTAK